MNDTNEKIEVAIVDVGPFEWTVYLSDLNESYQKMIRGYQHMQEKAMALEEQLLITQAALREADELHAAAKKHISWDLNKKCLQYRLAAEGVPRD